MHKICLYVYASELKLPVGLVATNAGFREKNIHMLRLIMFSSFHHFAD